MGHQLKGFKGGSSECHEHQKEVALRENPRSPRMLSGGGKQSSERGVMAHMSEGGGDSSLIPHHCAWGHLLILEEAGE